MKMYTGKIVDGGAVMEKETYGNGNTCYDFTIVIKEIMYHLVIGRETNGNFCCIPNHYVGCNLSAFEDVKQNSKNIGDVLKDENTARILAESIDQYIKLF